LGNDSVHVIWHDYQFIQINMLILTAHPLPCLWNDLPGIVQLHRTINDLTEQVSVPLCTQSHETGSLLQIIVFMQPQGAAAMQVLAL